MKKKIAMIVNSNIYSGLEKVAIELMQNFNKNYDFIYVTKKGPIIETLKEKKIKYYVIKKMSILEIRKFLKIWKPDIIHAHDYTASVIVALTFTKIPIISHIHNNATWIKKINLKTIAYLFGALRASEILIVSKAIEREYVFSDLISKKIKCIGNPICLSNIQKWINIKKYKRYDICCVGRLTEAKDPLRFIGIIEKIQKKIPNVKAIWIGSGDMLEKCKEKVKELGLVNNLKFFGYQKNPYNFMNNTKIFLLTSKWEGFGLAVIEAMALGLPCIVSSVGGLLDIVDDDSGKLCKSDDDFVQECCNLLLDDKYLHYKSEHCKKRVNKFDNYKKYMKNVYFIYKKYGDKV